MLALVEAELDRVTYNIIVSRPQNAVNPLNEPGQCPDDPSLCLGRDAGYHKKQEYFLQMHCGQRV